MASLSEAEPVLVSIEDRRFYDAAVLDAALASPDSAVRARAALAAGRIGDEKAAGLLSRAFLDPSPDVRESGAFAAGILGVPALSTSLAPLLGDPDGRVAVRAAWSLGFLEAPEGRQALLSAMRSAPADRRASFVFAL
jgi:HEAT repeat protein